MTLSITAPTSTEGICLQTAALVSEHYETLKTLARAKRRQLRAGQTLLTTDLLHESWLRLREKGDWSDEAHFTRTMVRAMRYVIIDHARQKLAAKRGDGAVHASYDELSDILPEYRENPAEIVEIGDLLERLADIKDRFADVVTMRYFGGFTEDETAEILGVTTRTVRRDWLFAKAWLAAEMTAQD
ncbi:ECF-type sigma factor [Algimonas porphyrae]|uniref:Extracytoplasmic sigma factor ECF n=1 Tax=Algimonas porphyrae TaxID=1128113 RepID=A0ABQ5V3J9_9PROT|nr:ECF-type sigma factor [Algimonas porphyrae]GLQ22106.1 extracytoplasmic sigma factor ECF [Algimonas porphyrae]